MALITGIFLVGILNTQPIMQIQILNKLNSVEECQAVVERIVEQEKNIAGSERVGGRLKCLSMSFLADGDRDGPDNKLKEPVRDRPSCVDAHGKPQACKDV